MSDDLVKLMNDARDFPANTCGASRHAAMIAEALCSGEDYPMLAEEPDHCGGSIAATVAALWECRTKLERAEDFLRRLERFAVQNSDRFLIEKTQQAIAELTGGTDDRVQD